MIMFLSWAVFVAAVLVLDRLMVWMERRGWIYWRERRGSSAASAIGTLAEFWDPSRAHVQAETRRLQDDIDDEAEGAPPKMRLKDGKVYVYRPHP